MKADYKNWIPKGMLYGLAAGSAAFLTVFTVLTMGGFTKGGRKRRLLGWALFLPGLFLGVICAWMAGMYKAFSYEGKRQMSKTIIEGVADHVVIPCGGKGLDVGCGSGALTIAVAKRNPKASVTGLDRWGREYASFSRDLCYDNARAEKVDNVTFEQGDAVKLPYADESFDAVMSNYVYHNISGRNKQDLLRETLRTLKKGGCFAIHDIMSRARYGDMEKFVQSLKDEGYEKVELIDTTNNTFMTKREASLMALSHSMLLAGKK